MNYYTWTHQFWLTSKNLHLLALCKQWMADRGGWQERVKGICALSIPWLWWYPNIENVDYHDILILKILLRNIKPIFLTLIKDTDILQFLSIFIFFAKNLQTIVFIFTAIFPTFQLVCPVITIEPATSRWFHLEALNTCTWLCSITQIILI